jgi:hypothetical protein
MVKRSIFALIILFSTALFAGQNENIVFVKNGMQMNVTGPKWVITDPVFDAMGKDLERALYENELLKRINIKRSLSMRQMRVYAEKHPEMAEDLYKMRKRRGIAIGVGVGTGVSVAIGAFIGGLITGLKYR